MLVHSNNYSKSTPNNNNNNNNNNLEPANTSITSSSSQLHHHFQQSSSSLISLQQTQQKQDMGCTSTVHLRPPSRVASILDSPTLARVERARLRLEASIHQNLNESAGSIINSLNGEDSLERVMVAGNKQSLLNEYAPATSLTGPIKRGLLWQQRDRIFSRWKERYFVLTRDYLHCFKRASGPSNGRASDMGEFIFKVKLVDVEKVEWLNRRSYSAIGLMVGREGRILLRCDEGLEDWFEMLEECTLTSKERRKALKIAQGPRSRASLAAPISHAFLQNHHFGIGDTRSNDLSDWWKPKIGAMGGARGQKLVTNSISGYGETNPFLISDSVPDLSILNNENHNHISGLSTNHSTPQKIPYSVGNSSSRYSNTYSMSQNNSLFNCNGLGGSAQRFLFNGNFALTHISNEEAEDKVELRRPHIFRHLSMENDNVLDRDLLYRKPKAPTDMRHSVQTVLPIHNTTLSKIKSDLHCSGHDTRLDTPPSTQRPSSYREQSRSKMYTGVSSRVSTEPLGSPFRATMLNSPGSSFRLKQTINHDQHFSNLNQTNAAYGSRYNVQERALKLRNKEEFGNSTKSTNRINHNEICDPNQNRLY